MEILLAVLKVLLLESRRVVWMVVSLAGAKDETKVALMVALSVA